MALNTDDVQLFEQYNQFHEKLWVHTLGARVNTMHTNFDKTKDKINSEKLHAKNLTAVDRIGILVDKESFKEIDQDLCSINHLDFPGYDEKLSEATIQSNLKDAIVTGTASIGGYKVVLGVMEKRFMMGSMGSVVGEKICRAIERAIEYRFPLILFTCSGGARMQEGMIALMQMAKTSASLYKLNQAGLLYIAVLTHPTSGGVLASFASLADIIIAEPDIFVGFSGPRVIKMTIGEQIPANFQRSEFCFQHGLIDLIVDTYQIRSVLEQILRLHSVS